MAEGESLNAKFLLPLIYIFPTYLLYFYILFIIFFSRVKPKFAASFYQLFGFSAINYIVHSGIYYIVIRMPATPFFLPFTSLWPAHGAIPTLLYMILYYSAAAIHFYSVCLSFNRFTVFILKIKYQNFWKKYFKYFLAFCLLTPFLTIWQFLFTDVWMKPDKWANIDGIRYFTQGNLAAIPWMDQARNLGIILAITSALSFIFNSYVVFRLLRQRFCFKKVGMGQNTKISPQDKKMCIYTILIFATEVVSCVQQFAFITVTDDAVIDAMFNIQYFIADISTLAPAWFILATNKNLRHQIALYFCAMKPEDVGHTSTVQSIIVNIHKMIIENVPSDFLMLEEPVCVFSDDSRFIYMLMSWLNPLSISVYDVIYNKFVTLLPDLSVTDLLTRLESFKEDTSRVFAFW